MEFHEYRFQVDLWTSVYEWRTAEHFTRAAQVYPAAKRGKWNRWGRKEYFSEAVVLHDTLEDAKREVEATLSGAVEVDGAVRVVASDSADGGVRYFAVDVAPYEILRPERPGSAERRAEAKKRGYLAVPVVDPKTGDCIGEYRILRDQRVDGSPLKSA